MTHVAGIVVLLTTAALLGQTPAAVPQSLRWEAFEYEHRGGRAAAERATLSVPERHARPDGAAISLALVRFRSTAARPGPPTIYLAGGPGSSGIEAGRGARFDLFMALRERGDVILLDQRGAGFSRPNLGCAERWQFDPAVVRTWDSLAGVARERVTTCVARLTQQGVDIAAYNTRESADDVEWLRRALGAPTVNLLAISYGTHLGLAVMRQHGAGVARAVLAGVVGPDHVLKLPTNMDRVFDEFSDEVRAMPAFALEPPLTVSLRRIIAGLEGAPARVTIQRNGQPTVVTVSAFDVRVLLAIALERRQTMRGIPEWINAMARGDFTAAAARIAGLTDAPIPTMMNLAVECASGATSPRRGRIAAEERLSLVGRGVDFPQPEICQVIGGEDLGDDFRSPVRSPVPTLLISGSLDLRTPASNAAEVRATLGNARHILVRRGGHDDDLLVSSGDLVGAIVSFISGGQVDDQVIDLAPIPFTNAAVP
jgi:pimeloyl-ACP methyl ester carboxylesterase